MRRAALVGLAAVVAGWCGTAFASGPAEAGRDWQAQVLTVAAAMDKWDCAAGLPAGRTVVAARRFEEAPVNAKAWLLVFVGACAADANAVDEAVTDLERATAYPGVGDDVWRARVRIVLQVGRPEDAVHAVEGAAATGRPTLNGVKSDVFTRFQKKQSAPGGAAAFDRLLALLEKANYRPEGVDSADALWAAGARRAAAASDPARTAALLHRLETPHQILLARLDGRYASLVAADPAAFDVEAAQTRWLARTSAMMAEHPDQLEAVNETVTALRALGRNEEALALAQASLDKAAAAPKDHPAFADAERQLNWVNDSKAQILLTTGHVEEALRLETAAAGVGENGGGNVSQVINLSGFQNAAGRPAEALATLAVVNDDFAASPYGFAWVHAERACADAALGRSADLSEELSYLRQHAADNPGARLKALLCANDLDGAAAAMIARLQDEESRGQALVNLSEFLPEPAATEHQRTLLARLGLLRARPDVVEAVRKVGRTDRIALHADAFIDAF